MDDDRFQAAKAALFAVHAQDPRVVETADGPVPYATLYHAVLARWVDDLADAADPVTEALRLAALCQHIRRWAIPRSDYPMGKVGYKQWRARLTMLHCEHASEVLAQVGYPEDTIDRVCALVGKKRFRSDPESGHLEDAVCLTFLELEYVDFARTLAAEKVADVVRKTWDKMTLRGRAAALDLVQRMPASAEVELVVQAVSEPA